MTVTLTPDRPLERDPAIAVGNAPLQGKANRSSGWFLGAFVHAAEGLRHSEDVEVKWGTHAAGESKRGIGTNKTATTLALLISGRFVVTFPGRGDVSLDQPGDYVVFGPDVPHGWTALADSVVITIRWPSLLGDQSVEG